MNKPVLQTVTADGATEEVARVATTPSPGAVLRQQRQQRSLSVAEVARTLNLSADTVNHLEQADYDCLPAPAFVRGYIRSYARFLELDADELINAYDNTGQVDPELSSTTILSAQPATSDAWVKWLSFGISGALLALVGAWWYGLSRDAPPQELAAVVSSSELTDQTEAQLGADTHGANNNDASSPQLLPEGVYQIVELPAEPSSAPQLEAPDATNRVSADETTELTESAAPLVDSSRLLESGSVEPSVTDAPEIVPSETAEPPAPVLTEVPTPSVAQEYPTVDQQPGQSTAATFIDPVAPEGDDKLKITTQQSSWVEIYDANRYRMVYTLLGAKRSISLTGAAPFSLFLGDAEQVSVELNGQVIDHQAYIRSNRTARFLAAPNGAQGIAP